MSKRINEEDRRAIINRTIKVLPNNPSAAGYSAEIIKKHIYQAIAGADEYDSDVNIVQLINACLDDVEVGQQNYADKKVEALNGAILERLSAKQDKTDNGLGTSDKTIIGAVNEVNEKANYNKVEIESNDSDISDLQSRVGTLERTTTAAETPIGRMTGSALPTSEQLNAFVVEKKGRASKANDTIIFILEIANETDKNYKYINSGEEWSSYEIPPIEVASNGTLGLIKGTYSVDGTSDILVDIVSGCITNIYYKNSEGEYVNLRTKINLLDESLKGIINGTQNVGVSTKAINDGSGNEIEKTYAKTSNVYTKGESDNKYLPSTYTNVYYYSNEGIVDDLPSTAEPQFSKTFNAIGEFTLFEAEKQLTAVYNFNKNSIDTSNIWVKASRDCVIGLKMYTFLSGYGTSARTDLSVDLSGDIELKAGVVKKIDIGCIYSALGNNEVKNKVKDWYYKSIYVVTKDSESVTIDVMSNADYPSTFRFNAQSINMGGAKVNGEYVVVEFTSEPQAQIDGIKNAFSQVETKINTTSASPITLADNTSFRLGQITTLTINNATSYPLDFMCEVVFTSGTGFSMDYSALAITFSGDDCDAGVFTPSDAKTYNILFFNNSNNENASLQAIVRGV